METQVRLNNEFSIAYHSNRLRLRKWFFVRFKVVSDTMSCLAILSIIMMIVANELTFNRINNEQTKANWFIKLFLTITTIILLSLILFYHYLRMRAYAYRNLIKDWRIELTMSKISLIIFELVICAIHPFPRTFPSVDPQKLNWNSSMSEGSSIEPYPLSYVAVDVALGLPMFCRLYLLGRSIQLHSYSVRRITSRSFGYLNRVPINSYFLIKTYIERWPTRCLTTFAIVMFFLGSWCLRACNYTSSREHLSMPDAMWLFIITCTTVGYGDLYPSTYCGRSMAAITALFGLLLSALLIAILAKKLVLTREEKYVYTFVLNTRFNRKYKTQAANIIKYAMKIWYLRRHEQSQSIRYFHVQQKLFQSIRCFQSIKQQQQGLVDSCIDFNDLITIQRQTNTQTEDTINEIKNMKDEVKEIKDNLHDLSRSVGMLQKTLENVFNKSSI